MEVDGTKVVGGVWAGLTPDFVVAGVGEGVLHVELDLVELPAGQPVDEGEEGLERRYPVPGHVEHHPPDAEVGPVVDDAGGQRPLPVTVTAAAGIPVHGGAVAELGQGGPAVTGTGVVGRREEDAGVPQFEAVALGREGPVTGFGHRSVGHPPAVGSQVKGAGPGKKDRFGVGQVPAPQGPSARRP